MINGAHVILYSKNADADRAFLRDIVQLSHVDVGGGWLIFGLPPSEVAVHPADDGGTHELYLMCDDIAQFCDQMALHGIPTTPVQNAGWGLLSQVTLPGGGKLGVYQPRHARPEPMAAAPSTAKAAKAPKPAKPAKPAKPVNRPAARKVAARTASARPAKKQPIKRAAKKR
jgi:catechol 2,3-dioxygenase-like lactoylglutathione lyase family enzyme